MTRHLCAARPGRRRRPSAGLTACSLVGTGSTHDAGSKDVVLVTHDSFVLPKPLIAQFDRESGYHLVVHAAGDGGTLTNKLVLTQGDPTGDVAFGVDNTFATRALDAGVFAPYDVVPAARREPLPDPRRRPPPRPDRQRQRLRQHRHRLVPRPPRHSAALPRRPGEAGLPRPPRGARRHHQLDRPGVPARHDRHSTATGGPTTGSSLLANGATVTDGWSQAYETDFTQGGGHGHLPIVVSYDSSPAFTVPKGATRSTTKALLDTCFRQVEYAGVLTGRAEPEGCRGGRRLPAQPRGAAGPARRDVRVPGAQRARRCRRPGRGTPSSRRTRSRSARPTSPPTGTTGCGSGATSSAGDARCDGS